MIMSLMLRLWPEVFVTKLRMLQTAATTAVPGEEWGSNGDSPRVLQ